MAESSVGGTTAGRTAAAPETAGADLGSSDSAGGAGAGAEAGELCFRVRIIPGPESASEMTMAAGATVAELAEAMRARLGQPVRIMFAGRTLSGGQTLSECGVLTDSTVMVVVAAQADGEGGSGGGMPLTVAVLGGGMHRVRVDGSGSTVAEIKAALQSETGTPVGRMRLVFGGRQLGDDETVKDCHIGTKHTLSLVVMPGESST